MLCMCIFGKGCVDFYEMFRFYILMLIVYIDDVIFYFKDIDNLVIFRG